MKKIFILFCLYPIFSFSQYGVLDETFGDMGKVILQIQENEMNSFTINSLTIDLDQSIYVIGNFVLNDEVNGEYKNFFISKFSTDGSLDETFGEGGFRKFGLNGGSTEANDIILTNDNMLAIVGSYKSFEQSGFSKPFVAKLDLEGNEVSSFGNNGIYIVDFGESVKGLVMAQDTNGNYYMGGEQGSVGTDYFLSKINEFGVLDQTFGSNGIVMKDVGNDDFPTSLKIIDNYFYLLGASRMDGIQPLLDHDICLLKYNLEGIPDNSFGDEGLVLTSYENTDIVAFSMDFVYNTEIYVGGSILTEGSEDNFYIINYNANGIIDNSFGENGISIHNIGDTDYPVVGAHLMGEDNIVLTGNTYASSQDGFKFALVSSNSIGQLNQNFGDNGIVITDVEEGVSDRATKSVKYGIDKIVVVGKSSTNKLSLVRYFVGKNLNLNDNIDPIEIQIAPNPTSNSFVINGLNGNQNQIQIIDLTGKIIQKFQSVQNNQTLNLGAIPKGNYIIKINSKDKIESKKLIVK